MSLSLVKNKIADINILKKDWQKNGLKIGLVPTMGALHKGHMSLVNAAKKICDKIIVSVFVNPTQFAPNEDFDKYPRTLDADVKLCSENQVDVVFAPNAAEMYPEELSTQVIPPVYIKNCLCGLSRPTHFDGVDLVVLKLFNITSADMAFFGEKDYQQLCIIKKMVRDLNVNTEIIGCPIARDTDGLALSSRNRYLTANERKVAPNIYKALQKIQTMFGSKVKDLEAVVKNILGSAFILEYFSVCDSLSLAAKNIAEKGDRALIAVKLGNTRLIDNIKME